MVKKSKGEILHKRREQLDRHFEGLKKSIPAAPKGGWIREIRKALMMTTTQLAKRLGVAQSNVSIFEKSEVLDSITLKSLKRIAEALECELHYVFVPKKESLEETMLERAEKLYKKEMGELEHQMRLEKQGSVETDVREAYEVLSRYDRIWEEDL